MSRLRQVDIRDYTGVGSDEPWRDALQVIAESFTGALVTSRLRGPASGIGVALHPAKTPTSTVEVLVHCDKPDGQEIITADLPEDVVTAPVEQRASVVVSILEAGLIRLRVARGWDPDALSRVLQEARSTVGAALALAPPPYAVLGVGRGVSAPEQPHEILICGGGPTNGVPAAYLDELTRLLDMVAGEAWAGWWQASPVKVAEVFYWFDAAKPGVRVRVGAKVIASIDRPVATMRGANPVELAHHDVARLTERLASRLDLPERPALR